MANDSPEANTLEILRKLNLDSSELLANMPGGFFIYKAQGDGELLYANQACVEIFGCKNLEEFKELTGFTFRGMVHPDDIDEIESSIDQQIASSKDKMDYVEYRIVQKDKTLRLIEDYGHYIHTDEGGAFIVFISDSTEKLEGRMHELERMNEELAQAYDKEREHRELLHRALNQANAANVAKTSFFANLNHDIRTLMNVIGGYSQLIQTHPDNAELLDEYARKLGNASSDLLRMLDETLEVSRMDSLKTQINEQPCSVDMIMGKLKSEYESYAEGAGVELTIAAESISSDEIITDEERVTSIASQLIDNAIKYTGNGGRVRVEFSEEEGSLDGFCRLVLSVEDNGRGMSDAFIERMFDEFERERNTTESGISGTGLGLSIVKHLTDLLSGDIEATSEEGVGTKFKVAIPVRISKSASGKDEGANANVEGDAELNVLVVEDNFLNREITSSLLDDMGYKVSCAENGKEAIDLLLKEGPSAFDVVLMDIQMPIMDGWEATKHIRGLDDERLSSIPIIAVTSNAFPEDRKKSFDCGMNDHLSKPISISELRSAIDRVC